MPVRILHIVTYMGRGGLETFLMNCYRNLDRRRFQFDFLVHRPFQADYDDEILALGGRIYRLPPLNPIHPGYYRALLAFFRNHPEYRIVHCHLDCMSAIPLFFAKLTGIPVRIAHAHSADQEKNWKYPIKRFFLKHIPTYATHLFACSEAAGKWMFSGYPFSVVRNGISANAFAYDPDVRRTMRKKLNAGNRMVIGHVGRFFPVKNHGFLVDVFAQLHARDPDTFLLLVGDGPLRSTIHQQIIDLKLQDSVFFAGNQADPAPWYQAMDLFLFPSENEGFGMAALEAQAAGLPCVLSHSVPGDCIVTDHVTQLPLNASASEWSAHILSLSFSQRSDCSSALLDQGFDISQSAGFLQEFYEKAGV